MAPLKVLIINHTSVLALYQGKLKELAKFPDIEPTLLIPPSWPESGFPTPAEKTSDPGYRIRVGKICYTGSGVRHFYLTQMLDLIREKPDIIDIVEEPRGIVTAQAIFFKNLFSPGSKTIFHTSDNTGKTYKFPFNRLEKYVYKNVDLAVTRNEKARELLRNKGFARRIEVITHGVELDAFASRDVSKLKERYRLTRPVIGYIGVLREKKGLFTLLSAAAKLKQPFQMLWVGDGAHRGKLERKAAELGLSDRLIITGRVGHREIADYLHLMDIFVLPSQTGDSERPEWREMFGRVLIEAMAAHRPLVGSDSGAIPRVIGEAGLIFPERNASALAAILAKLLEEAELRKELAEKAFLRVSENYSWAVIARKLRDVYLSLVQQRE